LLVDTAAPALPTVSMPYSAMSSSLDDIGIFVPQDSSEDSREDEDDDDDDDDDEKHQLEETAQPTMMESLTSFGTETVAPPKLKVGNWIAAPQKEALIYFSGFNSTLEKSLKNFGQFLAMTRVADHVYPIVFAWPGGNALTYRYAAEISGSARNVELLGDLLVELRQAGIRHIHFMSHSMGVQTLLHALHDTSPDGERSAVSKLFRLHHDFGGKEKGEESADGLLLCKSITMVNPDFPVDAFVRHGYLPLRRLCGNITVIGDCSDQALFISQFFNGLFRSCGCRQPAILYEDGRDRTADEMRRERGRLRFQRVIGRDFRKLYIPPGTETDIEQNKNKVDKRLVFKRKTPMFVGVDPAVQERRYLDIKDLEELIVTGRRASERSALLFREGNTYSYCHAPSFVSM